MVAVNFPDNWTDVLDGAKHTDVPRFRWKGPKKGDPFAKGTRIRDFGMTPEERLIRIAPEGSKPERLLFGWLVTHDIMFTFQEPYLGGRAIPGGSVVDFVVYETGEPIAIRVMSYWHNSPTQQWRDALQYEALTNLGLYVVDVWEVEINTIDKVETKMREILFGARTGGGVLATSKRYGDMEEEETNCPFCNDPCCVRCDLTGV